jgi:hypothetical protein
MKLVLTMLVLTVSLSIAGDPTAIGDVFGGGSGWQGSDAETIYWSQLPTGYAQASQNFTEAAYDAGVADDFQFATETTINRIRWWGGYWNGSGGLQFPVEIYLYLDDGTGNKPTLPEHTSAIASWMVPFGDFTEVPDGADYLIEYDFPTWVVFDAGQKYWFVVRKEMSFATYGQYGWIQSAPVTGAPCVQGFPFLGTPYWTPQTGYDAAFELVFDDALPLERSTWANIKTIF